VMALIERYSKSLTHANRTIKLSKLSSLNSWSIREFSYLNSGVQVSIINILNLP
jgi:hypothetical protein